MNKLSILLSGVMSICGLLGAEEKVSVLDTVVVESSRFPADFAKSGSSVTVIRSEDLQAHGQTSLGKILATVPGIHFAQSGPMGSVNSLVTRGATQKYLLVRVDGINVSDPSASQIAPEIEHLLLGDIERIEIIRGSQSSLYGGQAVAGVIEITTKKAEPGVRKQVEFEGGSYNTYRANVNVGVSGEQGDMSVNVEHVDSEGFSAADENAGNSEKDGYQNTTVNVRGSYAINESLLFKGLLRHVDRSIEFDGFEFGVGPVDNADNKTEGRTTGASAGLVYTDDTSEASHELTFGYYETDRDTEGEFPASFAGSRLELDYVGGYSPIESVDLLFGANGLEEAAETNSGLDDENQIYGLFVQVGFTLVESVYVTASGRIDDHSEFGTHGTWKSTFAYTPLEHTKFRAGIGTGFRAPSLFELFDSQLGNPDLDPETSTSMDVGIDHGFLDERGLISLTWFSLVTDDQIEYVFPTGYSQVNGESSRSGVEVSAVVQLTDQLALNAGYTYMIEAENAESEPLLRVPEHDLSLAVVYEMQKWTLSGIAQVVSGVQDLNNDFAGPPVKELDAYTVVNARVGYQVNEDISVFARMENVLDESYQLTRGYGTSDRAVYAGVKVKL